MSYRVLFNVAVAGVVAAGIGSTADAGSHSWRFSEIFSNADGSVQFIELGECCGMDNEIGLNGKWVRSDATGNQFNFPGNLGCSNCTANGHLLIATAAFAALPGAPTPDYTIPANFLDPTGDTLTYWTYGAATFTYGPGDVPTNGVDSLQRDVSSGTVTTGPNNPTNFSGVEGGVVASCDPADLSANGLVDFADILIVIGNWGPCGLCAADISGNGNVDFADILAIIASWGPC